MRLEHVTYSYKCDAKCQQPYLADASEIVVVTVASLSGQDIVAEEDSDVKHYHLGCYERLINGWSPTD